MKLLVRKAGAADIPAVHSLVRELAIYEKAASAFTASLADYQNDFQNGIFEALVAEADSEIVGMALYYMSYSTWKGRMLFLEDFVVTESYRRHGVGKLLFDGFLEAAREKGARIVKWQVLDWNEPALRFYQKYNAIIEKEWWNGKIFLNPEM